MLTSDGNWGSCGAIVGYTYEWRRNGAAIAGATSPSYDLSNADAGASVSVAVTAYGEYGVSAAVSSAPVSVSTNPEPAFVGDSVSNSTLTTTCLGPLESNTCDASDFYSNFGGRYLNIDTRGVRATIQTPRYDDFVLPSSGAGVMRVTAEAGQGLIQTGFGRTKIQLAYCVNSYDDGSLHDFFETMTYDGGAQSQECTFFPPHLANGKAKLYTVFRVNNTSSIGNATTWKANIDGKTVTTRSVGFDTADISAASGELKNDAGVYGSFGHPDGTVYGCFGCAASAKYGRIFWQRTTVPGSTNWANVTASEARDLTPTLIPKSDGRWTVNGTLPGPFSVSHTCDPSHSGGC